MNIKKIFIIICMLLAFLGDDNSLNEYNKLEKDKNISIKFEDLPIDFTPNAYDTVVEFIQKTKSLDMNA